MISVRSCGWGVLAWIRLIADSAAGHRSLRQSAIHAESLLLHHRGPLGAALLEFRSHCRHAWIGIQSQARSGFDAQP